MKLEITWKRAVRVWWSYFWRNLIATFLAFLAGMAVGAIVGPVMRALGLSVLGAQLVVAPLGLMIGLVASVVPLKMILGKDFGEFHLVLLGKEPPVAAPDSTLLKKPGAYSLIGIKGCPEHPRQDS